MLRSLTVVKVGSRDFSRAVERAMAYFVVGPLMVDPDTKVKKDNMYRRSMVLLAVKHFCNEKVTVPASFFSQCVGNNIFISTKAQLACRVIHYLQFRSNTDGTQMYSCRNHNM